MKTSFAAIACLAVAVLAQTNPIPAANVVIGQTPEMPSSMTQSLLTRLGSYFDMSHISSVDTNTPVMIAEVFDPTISKVTHLSMNVVQSGNVWYIPVCSIDSIATAGSSVAPSSPEGCQYGVQLAPVPQNAMKMKMKVVRTLVRAIEAAAREPMRYMFGRPATGVAYMPED
ncbi:hypothetical protein H4S07_002268 [Coemansia furcata]|uniref:Uncharacterized protein n=1 Tax=Coemansia furcata TaxID=417177 RepID=A0ACC1LL95_9FUNG|nr:hypothetical protein H4S07_002268 [Coemansia furcata]